MIERISTYLFVMFQFILVIASSFVEQKDNIWTFSSGHGFAENSKYLFLYTHHNESQLTPVWISRDKDVIQCLKTNEYKAYHLWSFRGILTQLRSCYSFRTHSGNQHWGAFYLKSETVLLGHGYGTLTGARQEPQNRSWLSQMSDSEDYIILPGSKKPVELLERNQIYPNTDGTELITGYPKTDALFESIPGEYVGCDENAIDNIKQKSETKSILYYIPTRIENNLRYLIKNPILHSEKNLRKLDKFLSRHDCHMYIKLHPKDDTPKIVDSDIENISILPSSVDLYPLLRIGDIFIGDYSSITIDTALLDRPVLFYLYDFKCEGPPNVSAQFGWTRRGSPTLDYDEILSVSKVFNFEDFSNTVRLALTDPEEFDLERDRIKDLYFDHADGDASKRIVDHFLDKTQ